LQRTALELITHDIIKSLLPEGIQGGTDAPNVCKAEEVIKTLLALFFVALEPVMRLQQDLKEIAN
jgi:hypothetical protein